MKTYVVSINYELFITASDEDNARMEFIETLIDDLNAGGVDVKIDSEEFESSPLK